MTPSIRFKLFLLRYSIFSTLLLTIFCASLRMATAQSVGRQALRGHIPVAVANARVSRAVPGTTPMKLAIGLALRNQEQLTELIAQLSDPSSPNYRHYLTPEQFTEQYGPTEQDYRALVQFARQNGLTVTRTHANRLVLDVSGASADVEKALHVKMLTYNHPTRGEFFAADREPSVDSNVTLAHISGLDNFALPKPMDLKHSLLAEATPNAGSGPAGDYIGSDFRAAYAPGVTLTGSGQVVGLLEFDGYYAADVARNFSKAGLTPVPVQAVLLDGTTGTPGGNNDEVVLDIMMAAYMAPGLSNVLVYEGYFPDDLLNQMAVDNKAKQLSSSWQYGVDATTEEIYTEFIAQGQSLMQSSGDNGAYMNGVAQPSDDPNLTVVGGTNLNTNGTGGPWSSESAWGSGGGGISEEYAMPNYQQGISMSTNKGSATMRNAPDVAAVAGDSIYLIYNNGGGGTVGGTSVAAPLWAGFIALVNQEAANENLPPVGFLNPLIYAIGKGESGSYASDFHDITSGGNGYSAVTGYDLATGWGSPAGQHLIDDLVASVTGSFTISSTSTALTVAQGGTGTATVTVVPSSNFYNWVNLAASGLPSGVTAQFSPASTTTSSTVSFKVGAASPTGTYTVTLTGNCRNLTSNSISLTLNITPTASFSLTASPASLSMVVGGNSPSSTISVVGVSGFSGTVSFVAYSVPSGVTATFSPSSTRTTSTLSFSSTTSATPGVYPITVYGTTGSQGFMTTVTLTVTACAPSFTIAPSPSSLSLVAGGSAASSTIAVTAQNGFNSTVSFTASGVPSGVTAAFSSNTLTLTPSASAVAGSSTITVTGTAGSLSASTTIKLTVSPAPSFTIASSPSSLSLVVGGSAASSAVAVTGKNNFSGAVSFAASGVPTGITASFSPASSTTSSSLTLTPSSSVAPGSYTITVTGTSGSLSASTTIALTVTAAPSFTIAPTPSSLSLVAGGSAASSSIAVTALNGFSGAVNFTASGAPTGVTAAFSSNTLTLTPSASALAGSYSITVTGTSGSLSASTTIALTVTPASSFTIAPTPSSLSLVAGGSPASSAIAVTALNGFNGTVNFTASGAPTGVTAAFSSNTLTLTPSASAVPGSYAITVTGTSGSLSASTTIALTVTPAPSFTIAPSPSSLSLVAGSNAVSSMISITGKNGFNGIVNLAASGVPTGVTASFNPASTNTGTTLTLTPSSSVAPGSYTITVTGTSGSLSGSTTIALTVSPAPSFTIAPTPSSLSLVAGGGAASSTIAVTAQNGFNSAVNFSASGVPSGVSATFISNTLTLTPTASAVPGSYTVTVTGTSSSLSSSTTIAVSVAAAQSFTLASSSSSFNLLVGGLGVSSTITVTGVNGFSGVVNLSATGLPSGVTAAFSPTSTNTTSTLTLTPGSSTAPGTYSVVVTGTSGNLSSSTTITVTVPTPSFHLSIVTPNLTLPAGGSSQSVTVIVNQTVGLAKIVSLSASGLPAGVTATYSRLNNAGTMQSIKMVADSTTAAGTYLITVTGTSATASSTGSFNLTVQ